MCLSLRNTASRGRSVVPDSEFRTLHLRRWSRTCFFFCLSAIVAQPWGRRFPTDTPVDLSSENLLRTRAGEGLARLDLHDLALVADALALVRLGLAGRPHLGGELPDRLPVGAGNVHLRRALELHRHVARDRLRHRVGVP